MMCGFSVKRFSYKVFLEFLYALLFAVLTPIGSKFDRFELFDQELQESLPHQERRDIIQELVLCSKLTYPFRKSHLHIDVTTNGHQSLERHLDD
jgi:hypothetical protein